MNVNGILGAVIDSLPMALGVALTPLPVAVVLVILLTARAAANSQAYIFGWVLGILSVGSIVFLIPGLETSRGEPTALSGLIIMVFGVLLLVLGVRQWILRPKPADEVETPKLLTKIENLDVPQAALTGFLLAGPNPTNLMLTAAGAATIDASSLDPGSQAIALLIFAAIASLTIILPVTGFFLFREGAEAMFGRLKDWLVRNSPTIAAASLVVFGALLIGNGLTIFYEN